MLLLLPPAPADAIEREGDEEAAIKRMQQQAEEAMQVGGVAWHGGGGCAQGWVAAVPACLPARRRGDSLAKPPSVFERVLLYCPSPPVCLQQARVASAAEAAAPAAAAGGGAPAADAQQAGSSGGGDVAAKLHLSAQEAVRGLRLLRWRRGVASLWPLLACWLAGQQLDMPSTGGTPLLRQR